MEDIFVRVYVHAHSEKQHLAKESYHSLDRGLSFQSLVLFVTGAFDRDVDDLHFESEEVHVNNDHLCC